MKGRRLVRRHDGRVVAGVAAGLGDAIGVDTNVVRFGFLVLTLAGGIGALIYGAGWLFLPVAGPDAPAPVDRTAISTIAFAAIVLGLLIFIRSVGPWPGDVVVWPLSAAMIGLAVLSTRPAQRRARSARVAVPRAASSRRGRRGRSVGRDAARVAGANDRGRRVHRGRSGCVLRECRLVAHARRGSGRRRGRARRLRVDHRTRSMGVGEPTHVGTTRAHPLRRARRRCRALARLGAADPRPRTAPRRRPARSRAPRSHAGTRAAQLAADG